MYTSTNFKTKKALKNAVADGEHVAVFYPNDPLNRAVPTEGVFYVEGPHYPEPHRWYGKVIVKDGKITKVL